MLREPEISGVSVVMSGNFNPVIFTPAWFALHELLPKQTADNAELTIIHPDLSIFSTEWLGLQITKERFEARTQSAPYVRLRNLLVRVFKEHLNHTPLTAVGINRDVHFRVKNQKERDKIGPQLAPLDVWGKWKNELELDNENGGMASLTMVQKCPSDRPAGGAVNVTIEPSMRISDVQSGIYVRVNDHYAIGSNDIEGRRQLMGVLEERFEKSIQRSDEIINHIMSL